MKSFEQTERAQQHYRRILSAKSSIPSKERKRSICLRSDPMKQFQYRNNNNKLVGKLRQIYDTEHNFQSFNQRVNSKERITRRKVSLVNPYKRKEYQSSIDEGNLKLIGRLMATKSTLGDWKERQKKLKTYSKITRRSSYSASKTKDNSLLFSKFKKQLMSTSHQQTISERPLSKRNKRKKRRLLRESQKY